MIEAVVVLAIASLMPVLFVEMEGPRRQPEPSVPLVRVNLRQALCAASTPKM